MKLQDFTIDFDCTGQTPFFQVHQDNRIRFIIDKLTIADLKLIIHQVFNEGKDINAIFISEYIFNGRRKSAKSKVGQVIYLKNWKEHVVLEDDTNDGIVYATIKNVDPVDVYNYCLIARKGLSTAYISFYSDEYLLYVSTDVIDIISNEGTNIAKLKDNYKNLYDTFHEGNENTYC
ncbi:hypothetical protein [Robertmurraya massiliosenegalensis]|uniref:hypothetical protein n=1 Tax=Robertmurraya massiliosenegalensis TaxID=1287657 RepID=UPI003709B96B